MSLTNIACVHMYRCRCRCRPSSSSCMP